MKRKKVIWTLFLLLAWGSVGALLYKTHGSLTPSELVSYRPESPALTCLIMTGLFLLKSVDFIMHSGLLYAANGIMFPLPLALLFNTIGAAIMVSTPFFVGKRLGPILIGSLEGKYPKLRILKRRERRGEILVAVLMRSTGLPLHVGSLYMGAAGFSFGKYMLGSLAGLLPILVPYTVMGDAASDIRSPVFIHAVITEILVSVVSIIVYTVMKKKSDRNEEG